MMSSLHEFSDDLAATAAAASKYVVALQAGTRFGASGVVWQPGVVVTTRSTVRRDDNIHIALHGANTVPAMLVGHDPGTDIAVLRFDGESASRGELASDPQPGHLALAVGRAENTGLNVALGVVSAIGKPWQTWQGGKLDRYIRLDLNLYPGGSGAAVVDTHGRLIGIVTGVLSRIAPLAIPAATIERVTAELLARGSVSRAWLGVAVQPVPIPPTLAEAANSVSHGLLSADAGTPAGKAGVLVGDILLSIGGTSVRDPMDLRAALTEHAVGNNVMLSLLRGGEPKQVEVTLGERSARSR
jgi:S1-C subfamily serine protease